MALTVIRGIVAVMLVSGAFPVGLWRARERLHQSLNLESNNHRAPLF